MAIFFLFLLLILAAIIVIFAFPQFSPIPYFPSNIKDLDLIIKALDIKNNQVVFDLGAGDGMIIFNTALESYKKKLDTKFIATEINPILLTIMHLRRLFHPNRNNISIMYSDMFKMDFSNVILGNRVRRGDSRIRILDASRHSGTYQNDNITFYLYISPWYLEKTITNIKKQINNFSIVSYMYPIKSLKKYERTIKGNKHDIFTYNKIKI